MSYPYQDSSYKNQSSVKKSESGTQFVIDFRKLFIETLRYWWLFLVTIGLSIGIVTIKHRYARPIFSAYMTILMEDRGTEHPQSDMMEGFGLSSAMRSLENQMAILSSWSIMRQTINELDFNLSYYKTGRVKSSELYGNIPFTVHYNHSIPQLTSTNIYLSVIDDKNYRLTYETESGTLYNYAENRNGSSTGPINYNETHKFGQWIDLPGMQIMIENNTLSTPEEKGFYFIFNNPDLLASRFQSNFKSFRSNENTSIVRLSVTGENSAKNIAFLDQLTSVFIRNNLDKKNQIATNTIRFIEDQLQLISDSLTEKGTELSNFRTSNQIQSISSQADLLFSKLDMLANQQSQLVLEKNYYKYLGDYFKSDSIFEQALAPATYKIENPAVKEQINVLIQLSMEYQTLNKQHQKESFNPYIVELKDKMEVSRQTLLKAISNQIKMVESEIQRIQNEEKNTTNQLYQLPEKERQLFGIERQFSLNNEVYTFLLRKRSEAQIQKASNTPDHSVLQSARFERQVYPIESSDRQKALLIGLLLPFLFLIGRQLLNNRITGTDDVERITDLPMIGNVIHNNKNETNVVQSHPKSVITEAFRRIRTRLEYFTSNIEHTPVIAISSSMPGEGKTFCAINIASVFAISGKKTLLMGFDLRKPSINRVMNLPKTEGISDFLSGRADIKEIIQPYQEVDNLFYLSSGAIPPNPAELIASPKTEELFKIVRKKYDVIIVDTPPMGIVSDAYLLARNADVMVFLTRQNFTVRSVFSNTIKQMQEGGIKNISVLLNDIPIKKGILGYNYYYGSKYGYVYGSYGKGHGYYED